MIGIPSVDSNTAANPPRFIWQGFHRNVYLMLLYTLGKGLQLTVSAISINLYAYSLGYRQDFIGLLTGMPSIGSFLAGVPVGLLADRFGRKPVLLVSALLTPFSLVGVALSSDPAPLLIASFCNGILASGYWVTNLPMLTESTTAEQRVRALSLHSFLLIGMGALGSLIGGIVPEIAGGILHESASAVDPLRFAVLAAAVVAGLPALPLLWIREPRRDTALHALSIAAANEKKTANGLARPARSIVMLFVLLLVPDLFFVLGQSAVVGLLQLYFALRFDLGPGTLGILLTGAGIFGGATALLAPRIVKRWGKLQTVVTVPFLSIPVVLAIGFAPILALAVAAEFARNILRGIFEPVYATFTMEQAPARQRATLTGFYGITWGVGYSLGATIAGTLQAHVSLSAPFAVGGACLGAAATILYLGFGPGRAAISERAA